MESPSPGKLIFATALLSFGAAFCSPIPVPPNGIHFGPGVSETGATLQGGYERYGSVFFSGAKARGEAELNLGRDLFGGTEKIPSRSKYSVEVPFGAYKRFRCFILKGSTGLTVSKYIERGDLIGRICDSSSVRKKCWDEFTRESVWAVGVPLDLKYGFLFGNIGILLGPRFDFTTHKIDSGANLLLETRF